MSGPMTLRRVIGRRVTVGAIVAVIALVLATSAACAHDTQARPPDPPWVDADGRIDFDSIPPLSVAGPDGSYLATCDGEQVTVQIEAPTEFGDPEPDEEGITIWEQVLRGEEVDGTVVAPDECTLAQVESAVERTP